MYHVPVQVDEGNDALAITLEDEFRSVRRDVSTVIYVSRLHLTDEELSTGSIAPSLLCPRHERRQVRTILLPYPRSSKRARRTAPAVRS